MRMVRRNGGRRLPETTGCGRARYRHSGTNQLRKPRAGNQVLTQIIEIHYYDNYLFLTHRLDKSRPDTGSGLSGTSTSVRNSRRLRWRDRKDGSESSARKSWPVPMKALDNHSPATIEEDRSWRFPHLYLFYI